MATPWRWQPSRTISCVLSRAETSRMCASCRRSRQAHRGRRKQSFEDNCVDSLLPKLTPKGLGPSHTAPAGSIPKCNPPQRASFGNEEEARGGQETEVRGQISFVPALWKITTRYPQR